MATATLNPVFTSISGSVGGIVLYQRYGRTIMRKYIMPPNPRTPKQQANRSRFRDAMASWRSLPDYRKESFNLQARRLHMTGHNLYISRYMTGAMNDTEDKGPASSTPFSHREKGAGGMRVSALHSLSPSVTAPSTALISSLYHNKHGIPGAGSA
ncbi:MAG TPA: hypothetical protein PK573_14175 [Spirochaetota bacterium]|nr:hypothetical protein [Spirochaetota bacterium]HRZ28513.1 hypothetical protein [Spirochaetota bacterium]